MRTSVGMPLSSKAVDQLNTQVRIDRLMEQGNYPEAERLVDAHLGDRFYGNGLPLAKAEILARRGVKRQALDLYLSVLHDPKMYWTPDSRDLAPVLDLAVDLGRTADADEIATRMIAHPASVFYDDAGVQTPRAATTPRERLAYAYLVVGNDLWKSEDREHFVKYASKAYALLPNSLPVIAQLGYAKARRGAPGDQDAARSLLLRARSLAGGSTRREIESVAGGANVRLDPPKSVSVVAPAPSLRYRP